MYEFDMRHVAGGKRQVYNDGGYWKKKIFSRCRVDMRHAVGGKRPVYYDDNIEILK